MENYSYFKILCLSLMAELIIMDVTNNFERLSFFFSGIPRVELGSLALVPYH
jgi:hypothetical protein